MAYNFDTIEKSLTPEQFAAHNKLKAQLEQLGVIRPLELFNPQHLEVRAREDFPADAREGVILDTESTGKDAEVAGILELGMVKFVFDPQTYEVLGITGVFSDMNDPGIPIEPEASLVNGITQEMVEGKKLDADAIASFVAGSVIIIAHNAPFDRVLVERFFPVFAEFHWACSLRQVDWVRTWGPGASLESISTKQGFFFEAHRAFTDCFALLRCLAEQPLFADAPGTALSQLIQNARKTQLRLSAANSAFATGPLMKARGYRWEPGNAQGSIKAWHFDTSSREELEQEMAWLVENVYNNRSTMFPTQKLTGKNRFSNRHSQAVYHQWPPAEDGAASQSAG